jgi:hypothetical protein
MTTRDTPSTDHLSLPPDPDRCWPGCPHTLVPTRDTPEAARIALHAIVCRERPGGTVHAFVFDPQGILSDCRYLLVALPKGWRTPLHDDPAMEARCDGRCARNECVCTDEQYNSDRQEAEIARLRQMMVRAYPYMQNVPAKFLDPIRAALAPKIPHG